MAQGSQQTLGGWEPSHCSGCGERVFVNSKTDLRAAIFHRPADAEAESWHMDCWLRRKGREVAGV